MNLCYCNRGTGHDSFQHMTSYGMNCRREALVKWKAWQRTLALNLTGTKHRVRLRWNSVEALWKISVSTRYSWRVSCLRMRSQRRSVSMVNWWILVSVGCCSVHEIVDCLWFIILIFWWLFSVFYFIVVCSWFFQVLTSLHQSDLLSTSIIRLPLLSCSLKFWPPFIENSANELYFIGLQIDANQITSQFLKPPYHVASCSESSCINTD